VRKNAQLDPAEQKCIDDIAQHGCHILKVFDHEGEKQNFAYSVGFPVSVRQPEVLIYGLQLELMQSMINEVYRQCAAGLELSDGLRLHDLIEGHECVAKICRSREAIEEHLGWAIWYHRSQREEEVQHFFQIVWPGAVNGLLPWEAGASQNVIDAQPALYEKVA
jgi:Domain of unknown function (DUF4262)